MSKIINQQIGEKRRARNRCATASLATMLAIAPASLAQSCEGEICFIDRGDAGEIVLGTGMRGPLAIIDYDRDGWMDVFVGNGSFRQHRLFRNVADPINPARRTFVDVTAGSGLDVGEAVGRDTGGAIAGDYDNDGDDDLYLLGRRATPATFGLLYRNNGDGTFTDVSVAAGLRQDGTSVESCSFADPDLDGDLDLMLAHTAAPFSRYFQNNGDGTFAERADLLPGGYSFSHSYSNSWMDYDGDGWPDCFLISSASTIGIDALLKNESDGAGGRRFVNTAAQVGYTQLGVAPMGIAFGDYDNDGDFDLGISDAAVGSYYRNDGGAFTKITPFATMFGWGVDWLDADNDGLLDFYTAGSWRTANPDNLQRNLGGGAFEDQSAALNAVSAPSQYCAQVDFDNDGRQDIITVVPDDFVSVYHNQSTTAHHWFGVELIGDGVTMNANAIHAIVRVRAGGLTQIRQISSGSSTTTTEDPRLHFGIGPAASIEWVEVVWPRAGSVESRTVRYAGPFAADQRVVITPEGPVARRGDLNCDGAIDNFDIDPFTLAIADEPTYAAAYPACSSTRADVNADGAVNNFDIDAFVELLTIQ
ncbi:MAG: VCBS repeat-containing protein [Phycisphaerales bacterium]|nr:VCBS repeat-containing protein [Phycisphaerales bacterium]